MQQTLGPSTGNQFHMRFFSGSWHLLTVFFLFYYRNVTTSITENEITSNSAETEREGTRLDSNRSSPELRVQRNTLKFKTLTCKERINIQHILNNHEIQHVINHVTFHSRRCKLARARPQINNNNNNADG